MDLTLAQIDRLFISNIQLQEIEHLPIGMSIDLPQI